MPLLRRPHDHRRELPARRRTPRSAVAQAAVRPRRHDARHRLIAPPARRGTSLPASHRYRPTASEGACYAVDQAKITPSTAAAATNSPPRSSIRRRLRRPAHPQPKPPHRQIPIDGKLPPGSPRVPSWEAFGRRPSVRRIGHHGPASETLHLSSPCRRCRPLASSTEAGASSIITEVAKPRRVCDAG